MCYYTNITQGGDSYAVTFAFYSFLIIPIWPIFCNLLKNLHYFSIYLYAKCNKFLIMCFVHFTHTYTFDPVGFSNSFCSFFHHFSKTLKLTANKVLLLESRHNYTVKSVKVFILHQNFKPKNICVSQPGVLRSDVKTGSDFSEVQKDLVAASKTPV